MRLMILPVLGLAAAAGYVFNIYDNPVQSGQGDADTRRAKFEAIDEQVADEWLLREVEVARRMTFDSPAKYYQAMCSSRYDQGSRSWKRCSSEQGDAVKAVRAVLTRLHELAMTDGMSDTEAYAISRVIECRDDNMSGGTDWAGIRHCIGEFSSEYDDQLRRQKIESELDG